MIFRGTGTALVTPFRSSDGAIDFQALGALIDMQLAAGIEALVPCGSTGEAATQSADEHIATVRFTVERAKKKAKVIAGTGSNSTAEAIELTRAAREAGADAALIVAPYYNKPTQEGMYQHFRAIAEAVDIPIILYNVPPRTSCNLLPETVLRLAEDVPGIVGIKEASGNIEQPMEILRSRSKNFAVYSGEDTLSVAMVALGGDGVISVAANAVPKDFSDMIRAALAGNLKKACELQYKLLHFQKINFIESNPIPIKYILSRMKILEECYRLPLVQATLASKGEIDKVAKELGLY